ncbi:pollen receptor-like kinase 4 [Argentina anserina]|uniref:pollen receptor-like kinase 4 n=1 Tax=Argentina anserina TaxID=57926 RepID=UPI0021767ED5|nr:pollen receptor-like kinase 4 [Potentilla anserina]
MGAHMAMARLMRAPTPSFLLALVVAALSFMNMLPFGLPDATADALLEFKNSLGKSSVVLSDWGVSPNPCNGDKGVWLGMLCFDGKVRGVKLEKMGLQGTLKVEPLAKLPYLKTLSFRNNSFQGPLPNLSLIKKLRSVFLSDNNFSGEIPDEAFDGLNYLRRLHLGRNDFSGEIPSSLAELPNLYEVELEDNNFSGEIPDFKSTQLATVDFSNNDLEGEIPKSLSSLDSKFFEGNDRLCGGTTGVVCIFPPAPAPSLPPGPSPAPSAVSSGKSSLGLKIALGIVSVLLILLIISVILIFVKKRKQQSELDRAELLDNSSKYTAGTASQIDTKSVENNNINHPARRGGEQGKLSFVRDDRERFDLHDLLRASAEILGSGNFGASYKALILTDAVVVKRYKQMNNVGREEFHDHMRRLGKLTHPNLLPLVAYYYRREEKLLVSDFVENSSLASHLHGNHNLHQPVLDWPTRLRIIKGIGRGLAYLYNTLPSLVVPHGHLKSSNVLLDENMEPLLNDYALLPVINMDQAQHLMMAYKSPEYAQHRRITKKTDVWCFGIIILEVLTGKFPENYIMQSYDSKADLGSWVNGMIKEKKTSEVFDLEMGNVGNSKGELLKLLKIGVSCCEEDVERRLDLHEVVAKIDELNEGESDGDYRSSVSSEGGEDDDHTSLAV